jgi:hypothetical protein
MQNTISQSRLLAPQLSRDNKVSTFHSLCAPYNNAAYIHTREKSALMLLAACKNEESHLMQLAMQRQQKQQRKKKGFSE